jgi:hypothetical protein
MKKLFLSILNLFRGDQLKRLTKKADKLYYQTGKQYLIIPFDRKGKLILVKGRSFLNDFNIKAKKMGYPKVTYPKLLEKAVYKTNPGTLNQRKCASV